MWTFTRMILIMFLAGSVFFPGSIALAATANDVNQEMRNAQNLYFKGSVQEADDALKRAEAMTAEVMAGSDEAEKEKVKRLDGRLKKLRKDIDNKLTKSSGETPLTKGQEAGPASGPDKSADGPGALPSHVISDLKTVEGYIDSARQSLNLEDIRNARRSLGNAQDKLRQTAQRKKRYITPEHPEYKALLARIMKVDTAILALEEKGARQKTAAVKAAADAKADSDKWVTRLKPYTTGPGQPGYDAERYFVAGYTEDRQVMAKQAIIFGRLAADMDDYRAAGPGDSATGELRLLIRDIEYLFEAVRDEYDIQHTIAAFQKVYTLV